jgi:hypothetical protein
MSQTIGLDGPLQCSDALIICGHSHTESASRVEIVAHPRGIRDQDPPQALEITTLTFDPTLTHDAA